MTLTATRVQDKVAAPRRGRTVLIVVAVIALVLAITGATLLTRTRKTPAAAATATPARATTQIRRTDLVQEIDVHGTGGYGATTALIGRDPGVLTWLPAPGTVIGRGQRLFAVDAIDVPLLIGDAPMYRELAKGVPAGHDIAILQQNLKALGYDVGSVDGHFRAATEKAVRRWQKARHAPVTGRIEPDAVVIRSAPVRVDSVAAQLGGSGEGSILQITGTTRLITAAVPEAQAAYATVDAKVTVVPAGGGTAPGVIRSAHQTTEAGKSSIAITVALTGTAKAPATDSDTITITGARRTQVLAVQVEALLALQGGGYALEPVTGGDHLVAVRLGMFANGLVEVSGTGLAAGQTVVSAS